MRLVLFHIAAICLLLGSPARFLDAERCTCVSDGAEAASASCCAGPVQCCVSHENDSSEELPLLAVVLPAAVSYLAAATQDRSLQVLEPCRLSPVGMGASLHPPPLGTGTRLSLGQAWLI